MKPLLERIDHLVVAAPDLAQAIDHLERVVGTRAAVGGKHPAWGTHNALLSLGERTYLEILAPDPEFRGPTPPRPCDLDRLQSPRVATWAAQGRDLEAIAAEARRHGLDLGGIQAGRRRPPERSELTWRMTDLLADREGGIVPFFVNWGESPHPAAAAPPAGTLLGLRAEHPDAARISRLLGTLGLHLSVTPGAAPRLVATLLTPRGAVELA